MTILKMILSIEDRVDMMKYGQTLRGKFVKRINRFVAIVSIDGQEENVHVKNTGRLKELLIPGAEVILEVSDNPNRKTKYSLIAARKQDRWVNIDSQVPNAVVYDALLHGKIKEFPKLDVVQREVTYGGSRFDLFVEEKAQKDLLKSKE